MLSGIFFGIPNRKTDRIQKPGVRAEKLLNNNNNNNNNEYYYCFFNTLMNEEQQHKNTVEAGGVDREVGKRPVNAMVGWNWRQMDTYLDKLEAKLEAQKAEIRDLRAERVATNGKLAQATAEALSKRVELGEFQKKLRELEGVEAERDRALEGIEEVITALENDRRKCDKTSIYT